MTPSEATEYSKMIESLYHIGGSSSGVIAMSGNIVNKEVLTESASGSESSYDLLSTPIENTLIVFCNGVAQKNYTISGTTIIFDENIPEGWNVVAWYVKEI